MLRRVLVFAGTLLLLGGAARDAAALGLSVPAASVGTLSANSTATSPTSSIVVTGLPTESWVLRVGVTTNDSTDGHLTRVSSTSPCNQGVSVLAKPLHLSLTGTLPSTTILRDEYDLASAPNPAVAQGSTPDTVNVVYSQPVGVEAIAAGCSYAVSVVYTVAAA